MQIAGARNSVSTNLFTRNVNFSRFVINRTEDTDFIIEVRGNGFGDYTLSVEEPNFVLFGGDEGTYEFEVQPGDGAYIAINANVNDFFLVSYDNRESGNVDLNVDVLTNLGMSAGKSFSGRSLASGYFISEVDGNLGLMIRSSGTAETETTVTVTLTRLPKLSLDEGTQVAELIGRRQVVLAFDATAGSRYLVSLVGTEGFPFHMDVLLVQNGDELGSVTLFVRRDAALYDGASFVVNGLNDGEILVVPSLSGRTTDVAFSLEVSLEALP